MMTGISVKESDILKTYAQCRMSVSKTAKQLYYSAAAVHYRLSSIRNNTGLDPRNFFDLVQLLGYRKDESVE